MTAKEASFDRERKEFEAKLAEDESLSDAALTKMMAHWIALGSA